MKFEELTLTPDPPVKGQGAQWMAKSLAGPKAAITGGSGTLIAELDGIELYSSPPVAACGTTLLNLPLGTGTMNITSLAPACSAAAPVAPGTPVSVSMSLTLGTAIPGGTFAIIFKCVVAPRGGGWAPGTWRRAESKLILLTARFTRHTHSHPFYRAQDEG